jgi:hypothetical protein
VIRKSLNAVRRLSPNCREAAHLISEAVDRELPLLDRVGLRLHLYLCGACRRYQRSIDMLRRLMNAAAENSPPSGGDGRCDGLPSAAKERILRKLQAESP